MRKPAGVEDRRPWSWGGLLVKGWWGACQGVCWLGGEAGWGAGTAAVYSLFGRVGRCEKGEIWGWGVF